MPSKDAGRWPAGPRLTEPLDDAPRPLGDGVSWSGVDAGPGVAFSGSASDYEIIGSRLHGLRLTGATFEGGRWADVLVEDGELSGLVLEGPSLVRVAFRHCRMSGLVAIGARAQDVHFVDCRLDDANFRGSSLERCRFEDCDLRGADFYGARFAPGALRRCRLAGAEFGGAACDGLDLRGSDLEGVRGATSLRRTTISQGQVVAFGLALVAAFEVSVEDDDEAQ
ncbi:MAG TPA: pentapeptide repeat-containing protein [Acidimicrobiales bacterium]|nr:pentapeptide repeat-containing protein [Acidimicrobiales bacterium]